MNKTGAPLTVNERTYYLQPLPQLDREAFRALCIQIQSLLDSTPGKAKDIDICRRFGKPVAQLFAKAAGVSFDDGYQLVMDKNNFTPMYTALLRHAGLRRGADGSLDLFEGLGHA
jgi:hypothetical protein